MLSILSGLNLNFVATISELSLNYRRNLICSSGIVVRIENLGTLYAADERACTFVLKFEYDLSSRFIDERCEG